MKVLIQGHYYALDSFEKSGVQFLGFIYKKQVEVVAKDGEKYTALATIQDGTTNEEVLKVLIDRLEFLHTCLPDDYTKDAIIFCKRALDSLDARTDDRKKRNVEGTYLK